MLYSCSILCRQRSSNLMRYDVIVVGGGPAGSTTARECATRGLTVLLLDKAHFPRDKPCGGGVTVRAAHLLPFDLAPVTERVISGMHVTLHQAHGFTRYAPSPLTYLTQRSAFDAFLVEHALQAGTTLREGATVRGIERFRSHAVVRVGSEVFEGRTVVAADGANGQTARLAGLVVSRSLLVALEGNITPVAGIPSFWEHMIGLDLGGYPGGYGWLFPKADHLNIGVGTTHHLGASLRERLNRLTRAYGFDPASQWGLRGHLLPIRRRNAPLADENILLVGDAAGLLDPLSGEGIYGAIWSGQVAATHLAAYLSGQTSDLRSYQREVEQTLVPELQIAHRWADLAHVTPAIAATMLHRAPGVWTRLCGLAQGTHTYRDLYQWLGPVSSVVDLASDLIRVSTLVQRWADMRDSAPPERFFTRWAHHELAPPH